LELNLSGKKLTDEGLAALADGLREVLLSTQPGNEIRLHELSLSRTALSVRSLREIADIINLSANHIRDIDLSDNNIQIESPQDEADWEEFLRSFRRCSVMKRLLLSSNRLDKPAAFEILARVYSQHPSMDFSVNQCEHNATGEWDTQALTSRNRMRDSSGSSQTTDSLTKGQILNSPCGLRSIPYIILQNVNINHLGALWLSYVLENHHKPTKLMTSPLKHGPFALMLVEYQQQTGCEGLVYKPYEKLSQNGIKLLQAAEAARQCLDEQKTENFDMTSESDVSELVAIY
jgi:hypothetical protein